MKTSFKKAVEFSQKAVEYLAENTEESKLKYAIDKVMKKLPAIQEEYNELRDDIEIDHANVDANGSVLYKINSGVKQYDYSRENTKIVRGKLKALLNEERFEFKAHLVVELPEGFNEKYRPFFEGFVIAKPIETV